NRQQEDQPVPLRVSRLRQVGQRSLDLSLRQCLCLFPKWHLGPPTRYLWAAGRWKVTSLPSAYIAPEKLLSAVQGVGSTDYRRVIPSPVTVITTGHIIGPPSTDPGTKSTNEA